MMVTGILGKPTDVGSQHPTIYLISTTVKNKVEIKFYFDVNGKDYSFIYFINKTDLKSILDIFDLAKKATKNNAKLIDDQYLEYVYRIDAGKEISLTRDIYSVFYSLEITGYCSGKEEPFSFAHLWFYDIDIDQFYSHLKKAYIDVK